MDETDKKIEEWTTRLTDPHRVVWAINDAFLNCIAELKKCRERVHLLEALIDEGD